MGGRERRSVWIRVLGSTTDPVGLLTDGDFLELLAENAILGI